MSLWRHSSRLDVGRLRALLALRHFESHALILGQGLEASPLNLAEVGEEILASIIGGDEAKAFAFIEPLHDSGLGCHVDSFQVMRRTCGEVQRAKKSRCGFDWNPPAIPAGNRRNLLDDLTRWVLHQLDQMMGIHRCHMEIAFWVMGCGDGNPWLYSPPKALTPALPEG
jgi:hypothetical protein